MNSSPVPSVPRLVDTLRSSPRPALLWYGSGGERVELSGRVLENWAAKTANLWAEELDVVPGDAVTVGAQVHWRTVVAVLGAWLAGAAVRPADPVSGAAAPGDRAVLALAGTDGSAPPLLTGAPAGTVRVLADPPALSLGLRGGLPAGADVDYCAEIRAHDDVWSPVAEPVDADPALVAAGGTAVAHAALLDRAREAAAGREEAWGRAAAVHVPGAAADAAFLLRVLAVLASGRAVLLTDRDTGQASWQDVLAAERATGF
ncbi:TIGR03089 family protein [Kocuria flava]|uniref:TIGR03089 family protein n=1 Tax=Kocuria flava TaxID=446860 RepID=A0ABQ0XC33_9MICC|nr:TIGR03089 family protein [Kocuria flava]GEO93434.1 hypothetical protein KFL01_27400 [Kocuria flava]